MPRRLVYDTKFLEKRQSSLASNENDKDKRDPTQSAIVIWTGKQTALNILNPFTVNVDLSKGPPKMFEADVVKERSANQRGTVVLFHLYWCIGLALLCLCTRLLISRFVLWDKTEGDEIYYLSMAQNLLTYHTYGKEAAQDFFRVPAYPFFIAAIKTLFGEGLWKLVVSQSTLTTAGAFFIFVTLYRDNRLIAIMSAIMVVVSPFAGIIDFFTLQESLYTFLLISTTCFAYHVRSQVTLLNLSTIGFLGALLTLTRDVFVLYTFGIYAFLLFRNGFSALKLVSVGIVVYLLCLTPWVARNALAPNGGIFLSRGIMGVSLWFGTWVDGSEEWQMPWYQGASLPDKAFRTPQQRVMVEDAFVRQDDTALRDIAVENMRSAPLSVAAHWLTRTRAMWIGTRSELATLTPVRGSVVWKVIKSALFALNAIILLIGVIGFIYAAYFRSSITFFVLPVFYVFAIYMPFYNIETRYSLPALPFIYIFFCVMIFACLSAFKNRQRDTV